MRELTYGTQASSDPVTRRGDGPPQPTLLESVAQRFEKSLTEFHELNDVLSNVADRLLGSVPMGVGTKDGQSLTGGGSMGRLALLSTDLDELLQRLRSTVDRVRGL